MREELQFIKDMGVHGKMRRAFPHAISPQMAISGFMWKAITPEGANRPCWFPRLEQQEGSPTCSESDSDLNKACTGAGGNPGWRGRGGVARWAMAVASTPTAPWKPAKHSRQPPVCAHEPRLGSGYWHTSMCTTVVLGRSVTFLVACPKGCESLLGWLLGRERKTLDNDSHSQ